MMDKYHMVKTVSPATAPNRRSQPLSEWAYEQLKAKILSNELQGGRYMLEDEVNELLGISRTPLRSALAKLEHEGLITIIPRRGIRIMTVTLDDLFEIYSLLEAVETLAIKVLVKAEQHKANGVMLLDLVDKMDAALTENNLDVWADTYSRFHRTLVGQTGMKRLEKLAENLLDQSHRVRILTLRLREKPLTVNASQRALALAIRDGDLAKALEINENHAESRLTEISAIFQKFQLTLL